MSLPRADPALIPTTTKEAFVDSLVNLTFAQVSGGGETGRILYGARPRSVLNSAFLLPRMQATGDDEVTSPIWVSSHGLQMQIASHAVGSVLIQPRGAVYVRILPTEEDLKRPDCQPLFAIKGDVQKAIALMRRTRLAEEWDKLKGDGHLSRGRHPGWKAVLERVNEEVGVANGLTAHQVALVHAADTEVPLTAVAETDSAQVGPPAPGEVPPASGVAPAPAGLSDALFDPAPVPQKWFRLDLDLPVLTLDLPASPEDRVLAIEAHEALMTGQIALQLDTWAKSMDPATGGALWGYRKLTKIQPSKRTPWQGFLDHVRQHGAPIALPEIKLGWNIQVSPDWLDPTRQNVFVALENQSRCPSVRVDDTEEALFLATLRVTLPSVLHRPLLLARVDPSYRYNRYLEYPSIGFNGGVISHAAPAGQTCLETTWKPRYVQPRIAPTDVTGVTRRVRALAQPESLDLVEPLAQAMADWLKHVTDTVDPTQGLDPADVAGQERERAAFDRDKRAWARELAAIEAGLTVLRVSRALWQARGPQADPRAAVYEAWLAMNEAMADFMQRRFGGDDNEWRLFQLAFIVANIPTFASRVPGFENYYSKDRDDAVTLLYFATGGGKSEAFFGLLVFVLLLDRLRGKQTGVSALLRYPLRLLTIQQAQRCSRVLAQAELVRQRHGYGGAPLAIGFWVGSGGSPNNHRAPGVDVIPELSTHQPTALAEEKLLDSNPEYAAVLHAWRKLPSCPFCGAIVALRRVVEHARQVLAHVCTDKACASNAGTYRALPFYIIDDDIYDLAPAVLLGTVDKLALIGHSPKTIRRIQAMFGGAIWQHTASGRLVVPDYPDLRASAASQDMTELYPAYPTGKKLFHDPFPSLVIQDEAHLLDESLGTFAGLFESALDAIFKELAKPLASIVAMDPDGHPRRPKVIAASATVSDPERQLEHLYQRSIPSMQFPHPGLSLYESFYARPQLAVATEVERRVNSDVEVSSQQARLYTAFMTNGKPHTATSVSILSSFHFVVTTLFDRLTSEHTTEHAAVRALLAAHVSEGPLQALHRAALGQASASDLATLVDLHRIALTYVTNKKGGDQLMASEAEETRKRHLNAGVPLDGIETRLITGSVEQGEIQAVVDTAQRRVPPGQPLPPIREQMRSVIATSAVSHGVDVDEFNSMFFAGMPSDIAEYIQASSRIGRMHVGFSLLIPTPQRRRDRHIVHTFDSFHRFLERMVQPAAIDHWAERAIERAFPSFLQCYLTGVVPTRDLLVEQDKTKVRDFTSIPNVNAELDRRGAAFSKEITGFLERAVGLVGLFEPADPEHYRCLLAAKTNQVIHDAWRSNLYKNGRVPSFFSGKSSFTRPPMTSLRDVDEAGRIVMSGRDSNNRALDGEDVKKLMGLMRYGVSDADTGQED